ncbi:ABC transporter permease [Brevibacterium sp. UCMA 11754]|uniref:ABC transporter permease n=1 Tax=Brevibacterium sp. UCMA 11754 TaxID=2749198 RepID=UPI001F4571A4|nr:ABC transporter permease [Brevibacterium sp. UCMA 11754]MCF2571136.1 ABC transporter permease [Brevibacterium sp. UCMA 11754]
MNTSSLADASGTSALKPKLGGRKTADIITRWSLPSLLVLIIAIATVSTPGFLSFDNIRGILLNTSVIGIAAVGMTAVTMSGNLVSLGVTQQGVLAAISFLGLLSFGANVWLAGGATLALLAAIGAMQGAVISVGLNPMITTLAVGAVIFGLATVVTGGDVVSAPGADYRWIALNSPLGLPLPIYIFVGFTIIAIFCIDKTVSGREVLLVGANRATARLSGLSHSRATIAAFILFGVGTALSGIVVAAQAGQATTLDLATMTSDVIAAVLVGGTAIQGGFGSPTRSALGALTIAIFGNVMVLHDFEHGWRLASVGALVVLMVSLLHVLRKKAI